MVAIVGDGTKTAADYKLEEGKLGVWLISVSERILEFYSDNCSLEVIKMICVIVQKLLASYLSIFLTYIAALSQTASTLEDWLEYKEMITDSYS